jgi:predicted nucleotidyltransferase
MDRNLKKHVINKIKELYPRIDDREIIVLYGSRAKGYANPLSDIDIWIFTRRTGYFEKISIEKNLRKKGEDPGFETRIDGDIMLEVKIKELKIPRFDCMLYNDIIYAEPLTSAKEFANFQRKIKNEFNKNYKDLLFKAYVNFFNEFRNLAGISIREDGLSKINLSMKKGIVIQALLRLIMVIEKKPYTFDKFLAHEASMSEDWKKIKGFIYNINKIDSYKKYCSIKDEIRDYINGKMPKRPYVANWWKFLKKFKGY